MAFFVIEECKMSEAGT